jgi:hypothetical protein
MISYYSLGASSARHDILRGTVLTVEERIQYANKIWPKGQEPEIDYYSKKKGHWGCGNLRHVFWAWDDLKSEWVNSYTEVIESELKEQFDWDCRG